MCEQPHIICGVRATSFINAALTMHNELEGHHRGQTPRLKT